jgi:hypothetical protein
MKMVLLVADNHTMHASKLAAEGSRGFFRRFNNMAKKSYNEKLHDSKNMPEIVEVTDPKQF